MESSVYNQKGEVVGKLTLPEGVFGHSWNADLVHQVVTSMQSNQRESLAHTKDRSEVRGGGKKPWKQKGTGRARHGSSRSPIWVGGGVAHGPRKEKNFFKKVSKKMRTKALYTILSAKARDGEVIFVDSIALREPKTKEAQTIVSALAKGTNTPALAWKKGNRALFAIAEGGKEVYRSFRNLPAVHFDEVRNLDPITVLSYKYLVIANPEKSLQTLAEKTA